MIELQYESKFDGFLVDLRVGPAEELNQAMFGGEPVFTYKRGATISADTMPAETFGCLVWVERLDGSPESIATLFHELVHASALRFAKSGGRLVRPRVVRRADGQFSWGARRGVSGGDSESRRLCEMSCQDAANRKIAYLPEFLFVKGMTHEHT